MSFQDELNQVTQTQSEKDKESYTYGVDQASRAYREIKNELLDCAKEEKYEENGSKKRITYKYSDNWFFDDILELRRRDIFINKSFFNKSGEHAYEARFDIKDQIAFDAYMETLQQLCKNDGISIKLTVCYNSLDGERRYDIDEKIIDHALMTYNVKVYVICVVEY